MSDEENLLRWSSANQVDEGTISDEKFQWNCVKYQLAFCKFEQDKIENHLPLNQAKHTHQ